MVTHGSLSVNRDCDTIPQLSNYSTKYFLHFSDDKCKTIHDILKEHTQFSQKKYSVTFTSEKTSYPSQTKKSLLLCNIYFLQILHAIWYIPFLGPAETTSFKCKSAWLINYFNYYDSYLHLPFQLQLLQDVSESYVCLPLRYSEPLHHSALWHYIHQHFVKVPSTHQPHV